MDNMKDISLRMKSIEDTKKITNAMYLISSSKLKKAKKSYQQTAPYFEQLQSAIAMILLHSPDIEHQYFDTRPKTKKKKRGFVLITSDKGLCGAYNHNVLRMADTLLSKEGGDILFTVGLVGAKYFEKKKVTIKDDFLFITQRPSMGNAGEISDQLLELFHAQELDEIYIIYTKMTSAITSEPQVIRVLPLEHHFFSELKSEKMKYIMQYTPSVHEVMDHLVPNYLKGLIFGALISSFSSEQNARMLAMDSATKSAKDMLEDLSLAYNRARQAAITQEISEIVGGARR